MNLRALRKEIDRLEAVRSDLSDYETLARQAMELETFWTEPWSQRLDDWLAVGDRRDAVAYRLTDLRRSLCRLQSQAVGSG